MRRVTLTQYLVEQQRNHDKVSPELRLLIEVVARACKAIGHAVSKGALAGVLGSAGTENVQGEAQNKDFNMRWGASMVADVYRILSRGGVFMYPRDARHKNGRLRLMYEANPMAFIVERVTAYHAKN